MSLVAYTVTSSDEESDHDSDEEAQKVDTITKKPNEINKSDLIQDNISDDEDVYTAADVDLEDLHKPHAHKPFALNLPKPVNECLESVNEINSEDNNIALKFAALPMPKHKIAPSKAIIEEDDEFLRKKVEPEKIPIEKPPGPIVKGPVKITIPSLKNFTDVTKDLAKKAKNTNVSSQPNLKSCGLLTILPKPKSEQNFAKTSSEVSNTTTATETATDVVTNKPPVSSFKSSLIPDTVKNRRPAHNTEGVDGIKVPKKKANAEMPTKPKPAPIVDNESEDSDDDAVDFFSLKSDIPLPEVNTNEINALVASKAAKIANVRNKYLASNDEKLPQEASAQHSAQTEEEMREAQKRYHEQRLDEDAMQALVGSSSKRRRKEENQIQIVDISAAEVLPSREEWMRTALASSTEYQPTGVLNDDEPAAGTRRKHQITYLAHKAKANEAELQAMWSANRQSRRVTQNKYGF